MDTASRGLKPFLRWAGGKQWISRKLAQAIPHDSGTYYEPFLGGGSLFFATLPDKAVLSDINSRLVETYQVVRDNPFVVIPILEGWKNDEHTYYRIRGTEFDEPSFRAAQFIYLNRTCWNGLYRVNKEGKFNVPFGNHGRTIVNTDHLLKISRALRNAEILCADFCTTTMHAKMGDFVYMDPPYTSFQRSNGFRQYNEIPFSWNDQERLARAAVEIGRCWL